jgi:type IV fimbrial biogenesis protein FimT
MKYNPTLFGNSSQAMRSAGFTLIELLVTIAMVAILAGLAAPSFNELRINQKLSSHSSDLFSSILQARNESMRLSRQVTVAPIAVKDWTSGWQVFVDMNANNTFNSGVDTLIVASPSIPYGFTATGKTGLEAPAFFSFDPRGFLIDVNNSRVIFKSTDTLREKQVIVSVTGRARICDPRLTNACGSGY